MNVSKLFVPKLILAAAVICIGEVYANCPNNNVDTSAQKCLAVTSVWQGRPEYKLMLTRAEGINVKSRNVWYDDVSYYFDSTIMVVKEPVHTNGYHSDLSCDVKITGILSICDDPLSPGQVHVPFGRTNTTQRPFVMQWDGRQEVESVYLKVDGGTTLMLVENSNPQYIAQIRLVSTDIKWNPKPSEDGYLYGRLALDFDYAPVLFSKNNVLRVAEVRGSSQTGRTRIGEISVRVPMVQR